MATIVRTKEGNWRAQVRRNWNLPRAMILVAGRTTAPRILTCRSGNVNDECNVSNQLDQPSNFSLLTRPFTTHSTSSAN